MIRAVVFDLDGTLVDSFEDIALAANHALSSLGMDSVLLETVKTQVGRGLRNLMRGLMQGASEAEVDRAVKLVEAYYQIHPTERSKLYPGALETLDRLGELGVRRAVLSNKIDSLVGKIAQNLGFENKMESIWGHREGWPLKPDPASLHAVLDEFGVGPSECLIVGDADPDRLLAKQAGAHFCGVTYGMTSRRLWEELRVSHVVDSLPEVPGILAAINGVEEASPSG